MACGGFIGEACGGKNMGRLREPMLCVNVAPAEAGDRYRLLDALNVLTEEDPLLKVRVSEQIRGNTVDLFESCR